MFWNDYVNKTLIDNIVRHLSNIIYWDDWNIMFCTMSHKLQIT